MVGLTITYRPRKPHGHFSIGTAACQRTDRLMIDRIPSAFGQHNPRRLARPPERRTRAAWQCSNARSEKRLECLRRRGVDARGILHGTHAARSASKWRLRCRWGFAVCHHHLDNSSGRSSMERSPSWSSWRSGASNWLATPSWSDPKSATPARPSRSRTKESAWRTKRRVTSSSPSRAAGWAAPLASGLGSGSFIVSCEHMAAASASTAALAVERASPSDCRNIWPRLHVAQKADRSAPGLGFFLPGCLACAGTLDTKVLMLSLPLAEVLAKRGVHSGT
jgi:hypothetical protein